MFHEIVYGINLENFMKANQTRIVTGIFALAMILILPACQTTYYAGMEKLGVHKRDIMVSRVEKARDSQQAAKEQFKTALERFSEVVGLPGGKLKDKYDKLKQEFERSEDRADEVRERIDSVESVSEALFEEWRDELGQYSNEKLRSSSAAKLKATRRQYQKLISSMKRAEKRIDPVLNVFRDHVLYLKHNLNAQAIASLQTELVSVEANVGRLIREMEASIQESERFIKSMGE